jgi:hypothetical protein
MLDVDLAELYEVSTKALNQAVKRNRERFPGDFMFRLTAEEVAQVNRSQVVTGSQKHRDPRYKPFAFTEYGVAMLSSVLKSRRAIQANIAIMRTFGKVREMLASHRELGRRLDELEARYDKNFREVFSVIRALMAPAEGTRKQRIGFR